MMSKSTATGLSGRLQETERRHLTLIELLATIAQGADDLAAASQYIMGKSDTGPLYVYGISSGALRAALFAERHPERVKRLALDAFVWTGKGSPTLAQRREKLPQWKASTFSPALIG